MSDSGETALTTALTGSHAAVYGYGIVIAALDGSSRDRALARMVAARGRRDRLLELTAAANATPAPAPALPAYVLPFPVTSTATARRLAGLLEDRAAGQLCAAAAAVSGEERRWAATAAQSCAAAAVAWTGLAPVWSGAT